LFNPPFLSVGGANFGETLFAVEDVNPIAIFGSANLVVDLGQLIAQNDLRSRYVINLKHPVTPTIAAGEQGGGSEGENQVFAGKLHG
jgi:hypothetical protein